MLLGFIQIVRIPSQPVQEIKPEKKMMSSIREGLRFVFSNQAILGALSLDLIAVLFGGATAMLPVFASDILQVGEKGFGFSGLHHLPPSVLMALYMTKHPPGETGREKNYCFVLADFQCAWLHSRWAGILFISLF